MKNGSGHNKRQRASRATLIALAIALLIVSLLTAYVTNLFEYRASSADAGQTDSNLLSPTPGNSEEPEEPTPPPPLYTEANILSVGDIMVHSPQLTAQYNSTSKSYDFTNNFSQLGKYLSAADYTVANFETTLAGDATYDYTGYPRFNSPDALADALKNIGFDMLLLSNNHINDTRDAGFLRTVQVLKDKQFDLIGGKSKSEEKSYFVKEVNGIKIGFLNYGYGTHKDSGKLINGANVPASIAPLIDTFDYNDKPGLYKEVEDRIKEMKTQGADAIVVYIHWGNEYKLDANSHQKEIAHKLSDLGVDVIVGSHPHVIQKPEIIKSEVSGKTTLCMYSLGNFISNQQTAEPSITMKSGHTEDGVMFSFSIRKYGTGEVVVSYAGYVPTWVHRYKKDGKYVYNIVPLPEGYENPEASGLTNSDDGAKRAKASKERTDDLLKEVIDEFNAQVKLPE